MAKKNNFILVDLNDTKTKKLAETITSKTSRKILNHLAEENDSKSSMSKKLDIPLPTITYHLQKLEQAGLVISKEFTYSKKGRVVDHYALANKYIIIAPKKVSGLSQKLRGILPVAIIALGISAVIKFFTLPAQKIGFAGETEYVASIASARLVEEADALAESAPAVADAMPTLYDTAIQTTQSQPDIALWFLIGSVSTIVLYIIVQVFRGYLSKR